MQIATDSCDDRTGYCQHNYDVSLKKRVKCFQGELRAQAQARVRYDSRKSDCAPVERKLFIASSCKISIAAPL